MEENKDNKQTKKIKKDTKKEKTTKKANTKDDTNAKTNIMFRQVDKRVSSLVIILTVIISLVIGWKIIIKPINERIPVPSLSYIQSVNITKIEGEANKAFAYTQDQKELYIKFVELTQANRKTTQKSISERPNVKEFYKVDFRDKQTSALTTIFVYKRGLGYYAEMPYQGIWKISKWTYNNVVSLTTKEKVVIKKIKETKKEKEERLKKEKEAKVEAENKNKKETETKKNEVENKDKKNK